jgi:hypothetical protein
VNRLVLIENAQEIQRSLETFNREAGNNQRRFSKLVRNLNQINWVYDARSQTFGPSKFMGFKNMNYTLYDWALSPECKERFHGSDTKRAIENVLRHFGSNPNLVRRLIDWAELISPRVTNNIITSQWLFVILPKILNTSWE